MMKRLLMVTAVIELGAGAALICVPSMTAELLLGAPLDNAAAVTLGRVAGAALLALGVACWFARSDAQSSSARGLVVAMVIYNLGAVLCLGYAGMRSKTIGVALWPAVILHMAMDVWCVAWLSRKPSNDR
jgi:hypothetical protein